MSAPERQASERETELVAKPARRRFTREYKRQVVREADGCKTPGTLKPDPKNLEPLVAMLPK